MNATYMLVPYGLEANILCRIRWSFKYRSRSQCVPDEYTVNNPYARLQRIAIRAESESFANVGEARESLQLYSFRLTHPSTTTM